MPRLSRADIEAQQEILERIVRAAPGGITLDEILKQYARETGALLPRRTASRRLRELVAEDRAKKLKRGRYAPGDAVPTESGGAGHDTIPASLEAVRVRRRVSRPLHQRKPVSYNHEFLDRYKPGQTWYLTEPMRRQLHERGRTPDPNRPAGTYARQIFERLLIDLAWASSKLEGNTYSRLDTQNLLQNGQEVPGADPTDAIMILNHKRAIEALVEEAEFMAGLSPAAIYNLHATLADQLLPDEADAGRIRRHPVSISNSVYTPPAIPQVLEETFNRILEKARAIPDPFERSFFLSIHLPYLQAFADVNKRVSRLAANIPLVATNLVPLSFVDVPGPDYVRGLLGVYELNRIELIREIYIWAYERSCDQYKVIREAHEPDPFRFRYRQQVHDAVASIVRGLAPSRRDVVAAWAQANGIPSEDTERFVEAVLERLVNLHEGTLMRERLSVPEFRAWRGATRASAFPETAAGHFPGQPTE